MINNRISTTTLDAWRKYTTDVQKFGYSLVDDEKLEASICRRFVGSKYMFYGTAFHSIMEHPESYINIATNEYIYYKPDEFKKPLVYSAEMIDRCMEIRAETIGGVEEYKSTKEYIVDGFKIEVVGKADNLYGTQINEYKTMYGKKDTDFVHEEVPDYDRDTYEEFMNSMQWKCYIDIFEGATSVKYYIFQLIEQEDDGVIRFELFDTPCHTFYPYPGIHEDIKEELRYLLQYIKQKGLLKYLEYDTNARRYLHDD